MNGLTMERLHSLNVELRREVGVLRDRNGELELRVMGLEGRLRNFHKYREQRELRAALAEAATEVQRQDLTIAEVAGLQERLLAVLQRGERLARRHNAGLPLVRRPDRARRQAKDRVAKRKRARALQTSLASRGVTGRHRVSLLPKAS